MKWYEITVNTTSEGTEYIADAFFSIGCLGGIKIIDNKDVIEVITLNTLWDYVDEDVLWDSEIAKVSAFVTREELDEKIQQLKAFCAEHKYPIGEIIVTEIEDECWYETWKKYYSPIEIGKFAVIPKWVKYDAKEGIVKILIDPGMAFGTGEHESTKMCLQLMSDEIFEGKDVIDVGTGSGILGIAATLSGAKSCYMCDIDGVAIKAAHENAALNGVEQLVAIENADLLTKENKKGDVVLANLTAGILVRLSQDLTDHIVKGGVLICSGIIHERKQDVIDAFTSVGFTLCDELVMGEWDGLKFKY